MTVRRKMPNEGRDDRHRNKRHRQKHRLHAHNPCPHGPRVIDAATEMFGEFQKHPGNKRHNHWTARLRWHEIRVDTDGFPLNINGYDVEIELSANNTDWFQTSRHHIAAKDDSDDNNKATLIVHHIHGTLAYRYRVRATSKSCKADWSDYFELGTPNDGPPAPRDVRILRSSHGVRLRWHAEEHPTDDEIFTQDIAYFIAEIWTNPDFGPTKSFTAANSGDVFTCNSHGFNDGDRVSLNSPDGGTLPDGVRAWKVYIIDSKTTNTFKLVHDEDLSPVVLTSNGSGAVHWGLVRKARHLHKHHHQFRLDVDDFDEDTRFYGRVVSVSDHHSKSAWIPATAPAPNDDPGATPTGIRPAWHRHVFEFTMLDDVTEGLYVVPTRSDDDYRIRRVTGAFHRAAGGGGPTRFDIKINGGTFVFDGDTGKMMKIDDGEHDGHSNDVVNSQLDRGDFMRVFVDSIAGTPPANGTVHVICDRRHDGSTTDSGGGGGE